MVGLRGTIWMAQGQIWEGAAGGQEGGTGWRVGGLVEVPAQGGGGAGIRLLCHIPDFGTQTLVINLDQHLIIYSQGETTR